MKNSKQILAEYWRTLRHYKRYVALILLLVPLGTIAFRLLPPLIAAQILQKLTTGDYIQNDIWASLGKELVVYTVVTLLGGIFLWRLIIYFMWRLETNVVRDLYGRMFGKFLLHSASYHADNFGGSMVSQTNKFIGSYIRLADTFVYQFYGLVISLTFVSITLYSREPIFVWVLLGFTLVFVAVTLKLSKRIRELGAIEALAENRVTGYLADAITNILAIKSFASDEYESKRFAGATEDARQKSLNLLRYAMKFQLYASTITSSILVMAVLVSVAAVIIYDANVATVFLMFAYAAFVGDNLWTFSSSTVRNYHRAIGDAEEAVKTLNTPLEVADPEQPEAPQFTQGRIEFRNVIFDHKKNTKSDDVLFQNLNLQVKPGEKIGLVGHSGGGKTTITKLLLRFMDIDDGEILIDGQRIDRVTQNDLRASITYVPQEPLLFHRTLAENISYGKRGASESAIIKASQMAHAHEFIKDLPQGYETLVGERGVKLSGGQRQRVAIARAMLKDAPILVLDEATSALDSESEVLIQDALWKLMEGRTAIVIAHRLSTIQKMDRIIVLDNGKLIEEGTHKDLLAKKNGTYAKLWAHQSGGFIEE